MKKASILPLLLLVVLTLTACKEVAIVHELSERDANKIAVLLAAHDIASQVQKTEKSQKVEWSVTVSPGDEMAARSILVANNLPKVQHGGLSGICKETPLILSPETEKCRKILAYKEEIINSLESIKGVVSADVVLNIPDEKDFGDEDAPLARPKAAVMVQYLRDKDTVSGLSEGKVQEFVSNSISGLDARDVAVIFTYLEPIRSRNDPIEAQADPAKVEVQPVALGGTTAAGGTDVAGVESVDGNQISLGNLKLDSRKFKVVAVMFLVLFLVLTVAFIFVLLRMARLKKQASVAATPTDEDELADQKLLQA